MAFSASASLLEKRITSEWIEVRELFAAPNKLRYHLQVSGESCRQVTMGLRETLGGVVDFKRRYVGTLFSFFERLEFASPDKEKIIDISTDIGTIIWFTAAQLSAVQGTISPQDEVPMVTPLQLPMEELVEQLRQRVAENPSAANHPQFRGMLGDAAKYRKTIAEFADISPQISDERALTFLKNYQAHLAAIRTSLNTRWAEVFGPLDGPDEPSNQLVDITALQKICLLQAKTLTEMRSYVAHALQENYQVRSYLLGLKKHRDPFMDLLDQESTLMGKNTLRVTQAMLHTLEPRR